MKKTILWILGIIMLLFILAGILIYANYDNIKPFFTAMQYSSQEDIETDIKKTQQKTEQILKDIGNENIKPLNEEEEKKLVSGQISQEEAINIILGKEQGETPDTQPPDSPPKPENPPDKKTEPDTKAYETQLGEYIAEIYLIKAKYTGLIKAEEKATLKEFDSLPKEQRTTANKYKIGGKHLRIVLNLQDKCDVEVNELLQKMEKLLTENNQPLDLINQIKEAYEQEKELTKAQYINKYVNKEKNKL